MLVKVIKSMRYFSFIYFLLVVTIHFRLFAAEVEQQQSQAVSPPVTQNLANVVIGKQLIDNSAVKQENNSKKPVILDDEKIYFNFEDASLANVVNYLAERKSINIIPHKDLENQKVTLSTRDPLTLDRAWDVLLTLLEMNGFTLIEVNGLFRIVASKDSGKEPLPFYSSVTTDPEKLPDSDLVIRYIYFFKNIKSDVVQGILATMLDNAYVQINKDLQACIIKEKSMNIKSAMKIIKELDLGGLRESIRIITLKYADADAVEALFGKLIDDPQGQNGIRFMSPEGQKEGIYFSSATKIKADKARNNLILLGTEKSIDRIVDFIYKYIDVSVGDAESRIRIKEIRYAKAEDLAATLTNIINQSSRSGDKALVSGQFKFFEDVVITSDGSDAANKRGSGNRLIIAANKEDWQRIEEFIDKLDKPEPQVAIEVLIAILTNDQSKELSAQLQTENAQGVLGSNRVGFYNLSKGSSLDSSNRALGSVTVGKGADGGVPMQKFAQLAQRSSSGPSFTDNSPATFVTLGNAGSADQGYNDANIWAVLKTVMNVNTLNIINQPFVIANNGKEATVNIEQTRYVAGELFTEKGEQLRATKQPTSAGTNLSITPLINKEGVINLDVKVTLNDFVNSVTVGAQPGKNNRTVNTKATMLAGEILVLGGFQTSTYSVSAYKTPLFGDIPIIGNLFRSTSEIYSKGDLYVFIRPTIIKPKFDGGSDEYTQLKMDFAKYQILKNDVYLQNSNDPISRWFFKPNDTASIDSLSLSKRGVVKVVDDFADNKYKPKMVDIKNDPYFRVSGSIERDRKQKRKALREAKKDKQASA